MRALALAAILIALFASCGPASDPSTGSAGHPTSLGGTAWRLVSIGGQPPPAGREVTLDFDVDRLGGQGPCNSYAGAVAYNHDTGALAVGPIVSTKRACMEAAATNFETAFLEALQAATTATMDASGRLVLPGGSGELVFVAASQPVPASS